MFTDLDGESRLQLLRFLCSFAWADLKVSDAERAFVRKLVAQFELDEDGRAMAEEWLSLPPAPEDIDPAEVPLAHRQVFLTTILQMMGADGDVDEREVESFHLLERLLR
jgi:uncharacterized tellurite resistance protein B-like protein